MDPRIEEIILDCLDGFVSKKNGEFIVVGMDGREETESFSKLISAIQEYSEEQVWHATIGQE